MSSEKFYDYEGGILKSKTSIVHYSDGEVIESIINITYDDNSNVSNDKQTREDVFYLTTFGLGINVPKKMNLEYHEEYDEDGKKIFAYTGSSENMNRSATYNYDEEGNFLSKSFINYGEGSRNTTTFYNKEGKIISVHNESYEEVKKRWSDKVKSSLEYKKKMHQKLRYEVFNQDLARAFQYNKDGKVIEEYSKINDSNISYIYDKYGNLIKKVKENGEVLFTQSFKVCEE